MKNTRQRLIVVTLSLVAWSGRGEAQTVLMEYSGDRWQTWTWLGSGYSLLSDLNGDGIREVLVGAQGSSRICSGRNINQVFSTFVGGSPGGWFDHYGWRSCAVGDVDMDGLLDYAVSAAGHSDPVLGAGLVRVFRSSDNTVIAEFTRGVTEDFFGKYLWSLGDLNGDGGEEIAIVGGEGAAPADTLIYSLPSGSLFRTHPLEAGGRACVMRHASLTGTETATRTISSVEPSMTPEA